MPYRPSLIQALRAYTAVSRDEQTFRNQFLTLLEHPRAFFRDHLPGHITASCWIVDRTREYALLTHHAKLGKWLQPGGHADGQEDVLAVAQREGYEETGLTSLQAVNANIFDIDIHLIPSHNDFPEHYHYDVRFLFQASRDEILTVSHESHAIAWVHNDEIPRKTGNNESILRMIAKAQRAWS